MTKSKIVPNLPDYSGTVLKPLNSGYVYSIEYPEDFFFSIPKENINVSYNNGIIPSYVETPYNDERYKVTFFYPELIDKIEVSNSTSPSRMEIIDGNPKQPEVVYNNQFILNITGQNEVEFPITLSKPWMSGQNININGIWSANSFGISGLISGFDILTNGQKTYTIPWQPQGIAGIVNYFNIITAPKDNSKLSIKVASIKSFYNETGYYSSGFHIPAYNPNVQKIINFNINSNFAFEKNREYQLYARLNSSISPIRGYIGQITISIDNQLVGSFSPSISQGTVQGTLDNTFKWTKNNSISPLKMTIAADAGIPLVNFTFGEIFVKRIEKTGFLSIYTNVEMPNEKINEYLIPSIGQVVTNTISGNYVIDGNYINFSENANVPYDPKWVKTTDNFNISLLNMDYNGVNKTIIDNSGKVLVSPNGGRTWSESATIFGNNIAMSSNGQYQTITVNGGRIYISNNYGYTWTNPSQEPIVGRFDDDIYDHISGSDAPWTKLLMSENGQYQYAFANAAPEANWDNIGIWKSSDYGQTWENILNSDGWPNWTDAKVSSNGQYIITTSDSDFGYIRISTGYGSGFFIPSGIDELFWNYAEMSSNGKFMFATRENEGKLWKSDDFGITWNQISGIPLSNWKIAVNEDGKYQTAIMSSGKIWTSSNSGQSWTQNTSISGNINWSIVKMSSDGKYQTAIGDGRFWMSDNYGQSWKQDETDNNIRNWSSLFISSNGLHQTASTNNGIWNYDYKRTNTFLTNTPLIWKGLDISDQYIPKYISGVNYSFGFISPSTQIRFSSSISGHKMFYIDEQVGPASDFGAKKIQDIVLVDSSVTYDGNNTEFHFHYPEGIQEMGTLNVYGYNNPEMEGFPIVEFSKENFDLKICHPSVYGSYYFKTGLKYNGPIWWFAFVNTYDQAFIQSLEIKSQEQNDQNLTTDKISRFYECKNIENDEGGGGGGNGGEIPPQIEIPPYDKCNPVQWIFSAASNKNIYRSDMTKKINSNTSDPASIAVGQTDVSGIISYSNQKNKVFFNLEEILLGFPRFGWNKYNGDQLINNLDQFILTIKRGSSIVFRKKTRRNFFCEQDYWVANYEEMGLPERIKGSPLPDGGNLYPTFNITVDAVSNTAREINNWNYSGFIVNSENANYLDARVSGVSLNLTNITFPPNYPTGWKNLGEN